MRRWWIIGLVGAVVAGIGWMYVAASPPLEPAPLSLVALATPLPPTLEPTATPVPTELPPPTATPVPPIVVYVTGAVVNPGVYELSATARVNDAISAAGGLTDDADAVRVNLAARMVDEQQIYVPHHAETAAAPPPEVMSMPARAPQAAASVPAAPADSSPAAAAGGGLVNINTASGAELETLPKIGPVTAQRIIDYRTANGPFASIDDLQNVKGIGPATFATLAPLITVGG